MAATEKQRYAALLRDVEQEIFSRRGEGHIQPTNERMQALVDLLGDPQRAFRSIHLTGTNGKTSTARMIDELLRGFGVRTGRYTSPHLIRVNERIVIDGEPISDRTFVEGYRELAPYVELIDGQFDVPLSFFEIVTALAFSIFADAPVDTAVVEVGLGGAWDNTNVMDAEIAVVTPIGIDHTQYLGTTVQQIAAEKAGIIKPNAIAILAQQPNEAAPELIRRAAEVDATVAREGMEFGVRGREIAVGGQMISLQGLGGTYDEIFLPLHGAHQAQNAACALAAVEAFFGAGGRSGPIDTDVVREAFAAVTSPRTPRTDPVGTDDPARRGAQPRRHDGDAAGTRRGLPLPAAGRRPRGHGGQGRRRDARTARTRRGPARRHRGVLVAQPGRRHARGRRRAVVRGRPGDRRAATRRRDRSGRHARRGHRRRGHDRHRRARDRVGLRRRRGPPAAGRRRGVSPDELNVEGGLGEGPEEVFEPTPEQLAERARRADKATKGALAGILGLEAIVVLLVPRAIAYTTGLGATRTTILVVIAVLLVLVAGLVRRPWGIAVGSGAQVVFTALGFLAPQMFLIGALFIAIWLRLLQLRHEIVGSPGGLRMLAG